MDFDRARDVEENEKSRVDPSRELRSPMIWGVELYGPAEIGGLYAGLKKLGWSRAGGWKPEHNAASQIRRMRSRGAGAWLNLGIIRRRGDGAPYNLDKNFAALPDGVDFLIVSASQITPSLTAIVIGAQLQEPVARRYETELNKDRQTLRQRTQGSWSIAWVDPCNQKERAIRAARTEFRRMVGEWLARNLPGYFSGLGLGGRLPTMELLVAHGFNLKDENDSNRRRSCSWQQLLVNASPYETWDSPSLPGLQVGLEWHHDEDSGCHAYISLDPSTFPDAALKHYGEASFRTYSSYCDEKFTNLLVHLATIEYLKLQAQDLQAARENLKIASSRGSDTSKRLGEIGQFFDRTLGTPATIRELAAISKDDWSYKDSCDDFGANSWRDHGERRMLWTEVQSGVRNRSLRLADDEALLRTHFEQITTILSVQENIRLQGWAIAIAVLALAAAVGSLYVAADGPSGFQKVGQHAAPKGKATIAALQTHGSVDHR